jgi:hypothetical protein
MRIMVYANGLHYGIVTSEQFPTYLLLFNCICKDISSIYWSYFSETMGICARCEAHFFQLKSNDHNKCKKCYLMKKVRSYAKYSTTNELMEVFLILAGPVLYKY